MQLSMFTILFGFVGLFISVVADTPANCTYEDALGQWIVDVCDHPNNCSEHPNETFIFELIYPNLVAVVSGYNMDGLWTLIYNQGFELTVGHRKWLIIFEYTKDGTFYCDSGMPNWSYDSLLRNPRWFYARKLKHSSPNIRRIKQPSYPDEFFVNNLTFIEQINSVQRSWVAAPYPEFESYTLRHMLLRAGGINSVIPKPRKLVQSAPSLRLLHASQVLPEEFDWRNPPGYAQHPLTPVRDQRHCGSCYAFASVGALEARLRIASNFTIQPILSPQDIVECSHYSEGCDGGFPYLTAGKYAEFAGIPLEECNPYIGQDRSTCTTRSNCARYSTTNYHYVGGYYGACCEHEMKVELVTNGPFPVGFEVYDDFYNYKSGVYRHTELGFQKRFDPFELTNHAVLLVGYGTDPVTKLPYWAVKNSWGAYWGERGYFRILRGSDECGIESLAVAFDVVI